MKGYFKYVLAFVLVFIPTLVLAAPFASSPLWDMFQNLSFDPPSGDMSVAFLAKMFGAVPGVPQLAGAGSTILGAIFGVFNAGILALSGVFLSYTITRIVTETTMDGAAMGKSTTIWTSIRVALSTSLLVPQATGYSMINGIVMWVVIQSVGLADVTWNTAMDYLEAGGQTVASSANAVDYSLINYGMGNNADPKTVGSADVLRCLTCSYTIHKTLTESQKVRHDTLLEKQNRPGGTLTAAEQMQFNDSTKVIPFEGDDFSLYSVFSDDKAYQFPYIKNESGNENPLYRMGLNMSPTEIPKISGICGTISYAIDDRGSGESDAAYKERSDRYVPAKKGGLEDMIGILNPVAKDLVDKIDINPDTGKSALNPAKYVVYIDKNKEKHFFLTKDAPKNDSKYAGDKYKTLSQLMQDFIELGTVPDINWPLGSYGILSAAAAYQIALENAQSMGVLIANQEIETKYDKAKAKGWINAGSYYRLLSQLEAVPKKEIKSYRLIGMEGLNVPFPDDMKYRASTFLSFSSLLPAANDYMKNLNPFFVIGGSDSITLFKKVQTWIQFTFPYSELLGKSAAPDLSNIAVGAGVGPASQFVAGDSYATTLVIAEVISWIMVVVGAVLIAILPPVAIPILMPLPLGFLAIDVGYVYGTWSEQMSGRGAKDPIIKLQLLGNQMIESSIAFIVQMYAFTGAIFVATTGGAIVALAISIGAAFFGIATGAAQAADSYIEMMGAVGPMVLSIIFITMPIGMAIIVPMFVSGIMLSVYVPMIPYILFLFGVISWLISVLVLMAAAPIICFLMLWGNSSQENPLLAREAEQFLMQIIGVFFRPTLMVIGLIAGVVLSYIGVDLLNTGFYIAADGMLENTEGIIAKLAVTIGVIIVYTSTMIAVVNMCFSPIHLLYSEAMRVAGIQAPAVGMEERQMESVKGAVSHAAEAGGGAMKEGVSAMPKGGSTKGVSKEGKKDMKEVADKAKDKFGKKKGAGGAK